VQLVPASKLVAHYTGIPVHSIKAIVGANAFSHAASVHQLGALSNASHYEIMTPESVGAKSP
jgi:2-isopropylmalate synthase